VDVNYIWSSATINYEYGFMLVNFSSLITILDQSFVFPLQKQVFFSTDPIKGLESNIMERSLWEIDS
jgi:hypothetical protein